MPHCWVLQLNNWLIFKSAEVSEHFDTSAEVSYVQFSTNAEVSWVRSVCTPLLLDDR